MERDVAPPHRAAMGGREGACVGEERRESLGPERRADVGERAQHRVEPLRQEPLLRLEPLLGGRAEARDGEEETDRRRRRQIEEFRKNGPHVQIIEMFKTAHYCFVHKPQDVIRAMREFLAHEPSRKHVR